MKTWKIRLWERLYYLSMKRVARLRKCYLCGEFDEYDPWYTTWCDFGAHWACGEHIYSTNEDSSICVECVKTLPVEDETVAA